MAGDRNEGRRTKDAARAAGFYATWTAPFVETFGTTFQAGLLKGSEDGEQEHAASALRLAERAVVTDGEHILDAGCGVGGPAIAIAERYPRCTIDGVTIAPEQVTRGQCFIGEAGLSDRITLSLGDYHDLDCDDDAYDLAVYFESCGYSSDHPSLFAEAARVVRPGGRIYVKDVFAPSSGVSDEQRRAVDDFDELWGLAASPTLERTSDALEAAGCRILRAGEIPHVGTGHFVAAVLIPDPEGLFKLNAIGEHFLMRAENMPLFFGEILAEVG